MTTYNTLSPSGKLVLSKFRVFAYSVGHVLNDMCAACWFTYLLIYLVNAIELPYSSAGWVMFSGQIADGLATPLVGIWSDKSRGCPRIGCGKRNAWNFGGVLMVAICFCFVFVVCVPCKIVGDSVSPDTLMTIKTASYAVAAALFNIGWASVQVSHMSLVPEITSSESQKVLLNSARYAFTIISNLLVSGLFLLLLNVVPSDGSSRPDVSPCEKGNSGNPKTYQYLAIIVITVGLSCSALFLLVTKELSEEDREKLLNYRSSRSLSLGAPSAGMIDSLQAVVHEDQKNCDPHVYPAPDDEEAFTPPAYTPSRVASTDRQSSAASSRVASTDRELQLTRVDSRDSRPVPVQDDAEVSAYGDASEEEVPLALTSDAEQEPEAHQRQRMTWKCWFKKAMFYQVGLNYMFTRLAVNVSQAYVPFYICQTLEMPDLALAIVPLIVFIAGLPATFGVKKLNARVGRKVSYLIGAFLCALASWSLLFLTHDTAFLMYGTVVVLGVGNATIMVTTISMEADLVGKNCESGAFVYGAMSFTDKVSNGIAVVAIQHQLHPPNTVLHPKFFRDVTALIPGIAAIGGAIVAFTIKFPEHARARKRVKAAKPSDPSQPAESLESPLLAVN